MDFVKLEDTGKKFLERVPIIKKMFKRAYQVCMYLISNEKIKFEGKIKRVSPNDEYEYFFGYYDKSPWDATDRYMICLRVKNAYKSVAPKQNAEIIIIDTKMDNEIIKIAETNSWNVQQGCMAQWLGPDYKTKIIYNDFRDGKYCSVIYNFQEKKEEKVLNMPVYAVDSNGMFALTLDFSRLHRLRKGYGYSNLPDETKNELCPDKACIWKIDFNTGEIKSILKYTDFLNFETRGEMLEAIHKVNHIMINPSGNRFMVLHRWFKNGRKYTRLVTANCDGTDMYNLNDDNFTSHCYWKNDNEILSFMNKEKSGKHYYLMKDKTQEYKIFWPELNTDGHCSYSPNGELIVTDTYPNRKRLANVYICKETNEKMEIAKVFAPFRYDNDVRCDLHPRWNHTGNKICIDSVHEGKRRLYTIDFEEKCKEFVKQNPDKKIASVTVLMSTYNGEKYLRQQIDSLLKQKNVDLNILVRDDGSTDKTTEILEEYKRKNKLEWFENKHLNVQKSFLELMKRAPKSDFYSFCDQDDVWEENKLEIAIDKLSEFNNEKPTLYYSSLKLVDENLNYIGIHKVNPNRTPFTSYVISNNAGCTTVFNNKLLKYINKADPEFILMHDSWCYKVCVATGGTIYCDPNSYILYRQHGNNVVGLKKGLKGKINNVKKYIFKFKIQKQIQNLYKNYESDMTDEYKEISELICTYQKSIKKWYKLMHNSKINFKNKGLNIIYKLKVFLFKL